MKVKVLSLLVPALLVAGAANAAEVYNKDGNKLDLYGKVDGLQFDLVAAERPQRVCLKIKAADDPFHLQQLQGRQESEQAR